MPFTEVCLLGLSLIAYNFCVKHCIAQLLMHIIIMCVILAKSSKESLYISLNKDNVNHIELYIKCIL